MEKKGGLFLAVTSFIVYPQRRKGQFVPSIIKVVDRQINVAMERGKVKGLASNAMLGRHV